MKTVIVWALLMYADGYRGGGPVVIDNIATQADCVLVARSIKEKSVGYASWSTRCIAIRKVAA